jgi:hypothetical protein
VHPLAVPNGGKRKVDGSDLRSDLIAVETVLRRQPACRALQVRYVPVDAIVLC